MMWAKVNILLYTFPYLDQQILEVSYRFMHFLEYFGMVGTCVISIAHSVFCCLPRNHHDLQSLWLPELYVSGSLWIPYGLYPT